RQSFERAPRHSRKAGSPYRLCLNGLEVHEPRSEGRAGQSRQCLRGSPILLNLVVQSAENIYDAALLVERWQGEFTCAQRRKGLPDTRRPNLRGVLEKLIAAYRRAEKVKRKPRVKPARIGPQFHHARREHPPVKPLL